MKKGLLYGASAFFIWGFFPIYLRAISSVPAFQITAHRVAWSFVLLGVIIAARREIRPLLAALNRRTVLIYTLAGILLAVNWLTFVWAVNSGFVLEASLGYFINPLVNVVLGVAFLREKLRAWQWLPVGLAAAGVLWLTLNLGVPPWIALVLAFSFGAYGLLKKLAPLGTLFGLTVETGVIFIPAVVFLLTQEAAGLGGFGHADWLINLMLVFTGLLTAAPLFLFSAGLRRVPLSTMGLFQYISPSLQFITGVFLFGEDFSPVRGVGFAMVWLALLAFGVESYWHNRKPRSAAS